MRHLALPETLTVEALAQWITDNAAETINHEEKVDLTPETIAELEHKSSMASRRIDELKEVEKTFKMYLKLGTPTHAEQLNEKGEPVRLPQDVTIPPTAGLDVLNANRQWADTQLRDGYKKDVTKIYLIPFPENRTMVGVDIEGNERETYTREMTDEESKKYGELFAPAKELEVKKEKKKKKAGKEVEMSVESDEPATENTEETGGSFI